MSPTTLLIVEDQAVGAADLVDRLVRQGYKVCGVATSGKEALALARRHRPRLALMDIRLQGEMDGIQTAEMLRRKLDVPVIFLSAHFDEATLQFAKLTAPYGFLMKPFDERELQLNIELALHKHEGERQLAAAHLENHRLNASLEQGVRERTAELEAALTEIEGFVHAVAHHLRSPLRAMEGYSHLLLTRYAANLPDPASRFPEAISSSARHMARLVDDLLSFVNLRQQALSPARVDIAAAAREVMGELIAAQPGRYVDAHIEELPACQADPELLRRLLVELLSNALKFSRDRQPAIITVGVRPGPDQPDQHVYFVRDNGIGFDPLYTAKLFKLFSQLNLPEAYEGTGAGLAMALRITERMGGRIWAESSPEQGATFFLNLPSPS
ncbi:sensor histidine kinase [Polaromonas sp.]|uniref:sensor histidine kinase n=1 Tax=Polaromonas sp. TaxID=1869339 RepID=UPI002FC62514